MIKYFVNEGKGTVVAKMVDYANYDDENLVIREVVDYAVARICRICRGENYDGVKGFVAEDGFRYIARHFAEKYFSTPVIGKAKFNFDDACDGEHFDEEIGKELARVRCLSEYYVRLSLMMDDMYAVFDMVHNNIAWRHDMAVDSAEHWFNVENDIMARICMDADQTDIDECNALKGE